MKHQSLDLSWNWAWNLSCQRSHPYNILFIFSKFGWIGNKVKSKMVFKFSLRINSPTASTPTLLHRIKFRTAHWNSSTQPLVIFQQIPATDYLHFPSFPVTLSYKNSLRMAFTSAISFQISGDLESMHAHPVSAEMPSGSQNQNFSCHLRQAWPSPNISTSIAAGGLFLKSPTCVFSAPFF